MIDVIITAFVSFIVGILSKVVHSKIIKSKCRTKNIQVEFELKDSENKI